MNEAALLVTDSRHPFYTLNDFIKFRLTYAGGRNFIHSYLEEFSHRESREDFHKRRKMTHNPGFAAQALDEIIAGITQRMPEIVRTGGTDSYNAAISGSDGGVDLENSGMNTFIAEKVLPEMLSMGRCGVYVDMPNFDKNATIAQFEVQPHPYLTFYKSEDILNWHWSYQDNQLMIVSLLLRDCQWEIGPSGLPASKKERFRLIQRVPGGVKIDIMEQYISQNTYDMAVRERVVETYLVPLKRIPFAMFDIGKSLLTDAADIQIGLLNLASADLAYAINSNFPFYVEGYDPRTENVYAKQGPQTGFDEDGKEIQKTTADGKSTSPEMVVGTTRGRRYPQDAPVPAFIHPSSEPLAISMEKQESMKLDIRRLLNLNVSNVAPSKASAESKKVDQAGGLESGLSAIGLELQANERLIVISWAEYEGQDISKQVALNYPTTYSLKTDSQRIDEATKLQGIQGAAPSKTYSKEVGKLISKSILEGKVSQETLMKIQKEIDSANYITGDFLAIASDFGLGIVDPETAAEARGYDPNRVKLAQQARVDRMAQTAVAQTKAAGSGQTAARGGEGGGNPVDEKTASQNADNNPDGGKAVRGKGQ